MRILILILLFSYVTSHRPALASDGENNSSYQELKKVQSQGIELQKFLPDAPDGWTMDSIKKDQLSVNILFKTGNIKRQYFKNGQILNVNVSPVDSVMYNLWQSNNKRFKVRPEYNDRFRDIDGTACVKDDDEEKNKYLCTLSTELKYEFYGTKVSWDDIQIFVNQIKKTILKK